ncbi:glycosyltransferase [Thermogymnomonas acidicola]|uniref:glycosyltransferase n=1 Tax=Thermogymnomonas acidicola TaxID=399579 RepID=UPI001E53E08B|nr:glycosyltransferase [Thermogymnomonas acidicola]
MKVLWFAHRDIRHPRAGGAERTIYEVGRRLVKMGVEVNVVSVNPGNLMPFEEIEGVKIHRIRGNVVAHLLVGRMIRRIDPDVIIDDLGHAIPWCSPWFTKKESYRILPSPTCQISSGAGQFNFGTHHILHRTPVSLDLRERALCY